MTFLGNVLFHVHYILFVYSIIILQAKLKYRIIFFYGFIINYAINTILKGLIFKNSASGQKIQITYADGGTETWTINAALSSVSVVPGSNSNSLQPGDGKVKPSENCPKQG